MAELSERQIKILSALIEAFIAEAEPIGSEVLVEKRHFSFSPATVRNEMAILAREGYIEKPHTSAGRVPTEQGLRFYITSLMDEQAVPVLQEVGVKQRLFQYRHSFERVMREAVLALAEATGYLALATSNDGDLFSAGMTHLLEHPEFYDINATKAALNLLDHNDVLHELFSQTAEPADAKILIGKEVGLPNLGKAAIVFARFGNGRREGVIAALGPYRMDYAKTVPQVRQFASILTELSRNW
jgi:heat-inducible transcriptional repressor